MDRTYAGPLTFEECRSLKRAGGDELLVAARKWGYFPVMAGGAETYPDAITYPMGPPTVSGTTVTVDFLLNNPTRVTRVVADLVMANFFLDKVFATGGEVSGGAVLYDQVIRYDVYTDRDVEQVEPGGEFPILTGVRRAPLVAQVGKYGGKFPVTDEAKRRNNITRLNNQMRRVANTIVRKMNQLGLAELAAAIAANSREGASISWSAALTTSLTTATPATRPARTLAAAQLEAENNELGYTYDTIILNPLEMESLRSIYAEYLDRVMSDYKIDDVIPTPRKAKGSVYVLAGGAVGELRLEEPLRTTTEREGAPQLREQTWVQSAINPVMYVTDPFSCIEMTGTE
jgi:hypothetical protein